MEFWRRFAAIENVVAIKIAPFNRYATLDVVRGVVAARAEERIALYTGNDDHILLDLASHLKFRGRPERKSADPRRPAGALERVDPNRRFSLKRIHEEEIDADLLALDSRITDCNSAFFDVANNFAGCIPGCHEVLRRQGLLEGTWCLDPNEKLSPGQSEEIDRVYREHADLADDAFVRANLERWLYELESRTLDAGGARAPRAARRRLFVRYGNVPKFVMPSPAATLDALLEPNYNWWTNIAVTGTEIFGGYLLALAVGVALALVFTWSKTLEAFFMPLSCRSTWCPRSRSVRSSSCGSSTACSNSIMAFSIAVFPILLTTARGLRETEPELLDLVRSLKGSRWQLFTKIRFPARCPTSFPA